MMDYNIITFMRSLGIEVTDAELLWKLVAGALFESEQLMTSNNETYTSGRKSIENP